MTRQVIIHEKHRAESRLKLSLKGWEEFCGRFLGKPLKRTADHFPCVEKKSNGAVAKNTRSGNAFGVMEETA